MISSKSFWTTEEDSSIKVVRRCNRQIVQIVQESRGIVGGSVLPSLAIDPGSVFIILIFEFLLVAEGSKGGPLGVSAGFSMEQTQMVVIRVTAVILVTCSLLASIFRFGLL